VVHPFSRANTAIVVVLALVVAMFDAAPSAASRRASEEFEPGPVQTIPSVPVGTVDPSTPAPDAAAVAAKRPRPQPIWPAAGSATVDLAMPPDEPGPQGLVGPPTKAGSLPVYIQALPAAGSPIQHHQAASPAPMRVTVEVLDQASSARAGQAGLLLRVAPNAAGGKVRVGVDYGAFRNAYGADWSSRLRLVRLPECALIIPSAAECQGEPLASVNSNGHSLVSADMTLADARSDAPTAARVLLAAAAGPSGPAGRFRCQLAVGVVDLASRRVVG
jgi:hypothetical protein